MAEKKPPGGDLPKLAAPARRALDRAGVDSLARLSKMREADVAALHGMGPSALAVLKAALKAANKGFLKD